MPQNKISSHFQQFAHAKPNIKNQIKSMIYKVNNLKTKKIF